MFTGIIETTASILEITANTLAIARPTFFDDIRIGSSICASGTCLSVTSFDATQMTFDLAETTLQKTTLGQKKKGDRVNLERALKADGRFEGHIVLGHTEGIAEVIAAPMDGRVGVSRGVDDLRYPLRSVVDHARSMRKNPTKAEERLWEELRNRKFHGYYFRRQRPIGNFIVDFYCEEMQLAVEVDGGYHEDPALKEWELMRDSFLVERGVRVLHVTNDDVMNDIDKVFQLIETLPPPPTPPPFRGRGEGEGALIVQIPSHLLPFIVLHGSIAMDGVSLTVADIQEALVTVAVIPLTEAETSLGTLKKGENVNIETDILGKYLQPHAQ